MVNIKNQHNGVKNSNWQETNQLASYKHCQRFKLGTFWEKIWLVVRMATFGNLILEDPGTFKVEKNFRLWLEYFAGYIDLSKRRVSPEEIKKCEEKFTKAKTVCDATDVFTFIICISSVFINTWTGLVRFLKILENPWILRVLVQVVESP